MKPASHCKKLKIYSSPLRSFKRSPSIEVKTCISLKREPPPRPAREPISCLFPLGWLFVYLFILLFSHFFCLFYFRFAVFMKVLFLKNDRNSFHVSLYFRSFYELTGLFIQRLEFLMLSVFRREEERRGGVGRRGGRSKEERGRGQ